VPDPRVGAALAYDPDWRVTVMFGGSKASGTFPDNGLGDTWVWDGGRWLRQNPATSPPPRSFGALVHDPNLHRVLLFGGGAPNSDLSRHDTWAWDGRGWTELPGTPGGSWRNLAVFDDALGRVVLLALSGSVTTWTFDGAGWSQLRTSAAPPDAGEMGIAYDRRNHEVVLYGGYVGLGPGSGLSATWLFDGSSWRQAHPATSPPAGSAVMAYDDARGQVLLLALNGTSWRWDGSNWTQHNATTLPATVHFRRMAYDAARQEAVLFGGKPWEASAPLNQTWTWDGSTWTRRT
jgi:hypothetical protein